MTNVAFRDCHLLFKSGHVLMRAVPDWIHSRF